MPIQPGDRLGRERLGAFHGNQAVTLRSILGRQVSAVKEQGGTMPGAGRRHLGGRCEYPAFRDRRVQSLQSMRGPARPPAIKTLLLGSKVAVRNSSGAAEFPGAAFQDFGRRRLMRRLTALRL